jgi:beta-lactamase class A
VSRARRSGARWIALLTTVCVAAGAGCSEAEPSTTGPPAATSADAVTQESVSPTPTAEPPPTVRELVRPDLVAWARETRRDSDGARVAAAVSYDSQRVRVGHSAQVPSASMAKAYWVWAAAAGAGTEAVEPYVQDVFAWSSNDAAGRVIGQVGPDAINTFTRDLGMAETYLAAWYAGGAHTASDQAEYGDRNVTTVDDAVTFLDALTEAASDGDEVAAQVLDWMTLSPDSIGADGSYGGALVGELPPRVARRVSHKAGWLFPGATDAVRSEVVAMGVVPLPDGTTVNVAFGVADAAAGLDTEAAAVAAGVRTVYDALVAGIDGC